MSKYTITFDLRVCTKCYLSALAFQSENQIAIHTSLLKVADARKVLLMKVLPGVFLASIIYIFSDFLSVFIGTTVLGYAKSPISTVLFAVFLGIVIGNTLQIGDRFVAGFSFSLKIILRLGIILLGIRLSLSDLFVFGTTSISLILICISFVILSIYFLTKYLEIPPAMSYLIAIGTSICGATAIVATAPVIKAKKYEVTYAITNITIFGVIGMFAYPYLANFLFKGDANSIGLFLGTAIHETAQVAAAGLIYQQQYNEPRVLEIATITKLIRNTFLVIMIPLFAFFYNRGKESHNYSIWNIFPVFVFGFIMMVIFRSLGDYFIIEKEMLVSSNSWGLLIGIIKHVSGVCLTIAMASLGLMTNLKEIRSMGYRPFLVGFISALMVGIVSYGVIIL
tara:strand:- start:1861 stop:3045 length:1185 start_codon:yes stop_codon:yes gene_type:complete